MDLAVPEIIQGIPRRVAMLKALMIALTVLMCLSLSYTVRALAAVCVGGRASGGRAAHTTENSRCRMNPRRSF